MNQKIPYEFIDEEDVLKRLMGNVGLFKKLFKKYIDSNRDIEARIRSLLEEKNYADARLAVHTVKGTSANLGVTKMWEKSAALEKAIIAEDDAQIAELLEVFAAELASVIQAVDENPDF